MRIISQSGMIDLPYENVVVEIDVEDPNTILGILLSKRGYWTLAEYSTPKKAKEAIEMLTEQYKKLNLKEIFAGSFEQMARELDEENLDLIMRDYVELNVFRFPQDEEMEV